MYHLILTAAFLAAPAKCAEEPEAPRPAPRAMRQRVAARAAEDAERAQRRAERLAAQQAAEANQNGLQICGNVVVGGCNLCVVQPCVMVAEPVCGACQAGCSAAAGACQAGCQAGCGAAAACASATCDAGGRCVVATCNACNGCWELVPSCEQCCNGLRSCVNCTCGTLQWVGEQANENCIKPCCYNCLWPCLRLEWVDPCMSGCATCLGETATCVQGCANDTRQCLGECAEGCATGCATCTRQCVAECQSCGAECAAGCAAAGAACGACTRECVDGCATCIRSVRCLNAEELAAIRGCLEETGMLCLGAPVWIRDNVCCYPYWPTREQCQAACMDCVEGCATTCAAGAAYCAQRCQEIPEYGRACVRGCGDCLGECAAGCAAGCATIAAGCATCTDECCQGCARCCADLQERGEVCLADLSARGAACIESTRDSCHYRACVWLPSRPAWMRGRLAGVREVSLPTTLDAANRKVQRGMTAGRVTTTRINTRANQLYNGPSRRRVRRTEQYAIDHPEDEVAQTTARDTREAREDTDELREVRREAQVALRAERAAMLAHYKLNRNIRNGEEWARIMNEHMAEYVGPDATTPLRRGPYVSPMAHVAPTMTEEEYQEAHHFLHTNGAQYARFQELCDEIMSRRHGVPDTIAEEEDDENTPTL